MAYIKICAGNGLTAVVVHHGDDDAGAIFVRINYLDGTSQLFVPAPAGLSSNTLDRSWMLWFDGKKTADDSVDAYLCKELEIDRDIWIVEVESPTGAHCLETWLAEV